ncbi:MAG: hypothetical protein BGO23_12215 [Solirubrobacterales bacterium 67-14]|nr:MAG: hypothetical protein BGO23_12215 [Solirubrobacterales bacterium 67-14]
MTTTLNCQGLRKKYPGQEQYALGPDEEGVSIQAERGELLALLGPSGCGKTTTLGIMGGFVEADQGRVEIEGRDVTGLKPYKRPTNTVFQGYALFPHMNVESNVGFGLKMDGISKKERQGRVDRVLSLVGLEGYNKRKVSELSGGQAQRAALARAMAKEPALLLLDEPLGALDLKLRRQMQEELVRLKERSGTTFVHVTHDQEEACAIADRVAVMEDGRIVQVDTPEELFRAPASRYVAEFINAGTVISGENARRGDMIEVRGPDIAVTGAASRASNGSSTFAAVLVPKMLDIRPADRAGEGEAGTDEVTATISHVVFNGSNHQVHATVSEETDLRIDLGQREYARFQEDGLEPGKPAIVSWHRSDVIMVADERA